MKSMSFFRPFIRKHVREGYKISREDISFTGIFSGRVFSQITTHLPRVFPIICLPFALRL